MELTLRRFKTSDAGTTGLLFIDCEYECTTYEDEYRSVKVKGETRIPSGRYEVKLYELTTPLTQKYRDKYHWFTFHLEVCNVKDFKNVYIHVGNTGKDTDGCILVGSGFSPDGITDSVKAYTKLYKNLWNTLQNEKIFLTIKDEGEWN